MRIWAFTADEGTTLDASGPDDGSTIPYPWVAGEAHLVKVLTSTGTTFEHEIPVAVAHAAAPTPRNLLAFTLIGLYVGVIPVALGPAVVSAGRRGSGATGLDVLLALTVGLLVFLLVDAGARGARGGRRDARRRIRASRCSWRAPVGAYLALESFGAWLQGRRADAPRRPASPGAVLALLVAVGIGLHNFGEGLAIGAAFALGEAALGTLLIRLHAAQHDRRAGDRRADREGAPVARARWRGWG